MGDREVASYLYLNGLKVSRSIRLSHGLEIQPLSKPVSPDLLFKVSGLSTDAAVLMLCLPRVTSQLQIASTDAKEHAAAVWDAQWIPFLLGAVLACRVSQNIEGRVPVEMVENSSQLRITNYQLVGWLQSVYELSEEDYSWLEAHIQNAQKLMGEGAYLDAVHCLSSYYWHPHPRPQLSLLWAGIEGLFGIESELTFRVSWMIGRFLEPTDKEKAKLLFEKTKKLYSSRSKAVHGSTLDIQKIDVATQESALLLKRLVRKCAEMSALPDPQQLMFS